MRVEKAWMRPYLSYVMSGDSDRRAASRAQVSTREIQQRYDSDARFRSDYEHALKHKKKTEYAFGQRVW